MRSHLIPEFYLKGFTDPDTPPGNEPYCWVSTTERRGWYRRAPGKLCRQKDYYHVRMVDGSLDAAVEKKLGDVENRAREIIAKRVERPGGFSKRDRLDLSLFIATTRGRSAFKHEQAEKFALDLERRRVQRIYERLKANPGLRQRLSAEPISGRAEWICWTRSEMPVSPNVWVTS